MKGSWLRLTYEYNIKLAANAVKQKFIQLTIPTSPKESTKICKHFTFSMGSPRRENLCIYINYSASNIHR
jgi:hypothetical protein